ncbi:hypothetical protein FB451DRAFT_1267397, partial [Mycena latifolia]
MGESDSKLVCFLSVCTSSPSSCLRPRCQECASRRSPILLLRTSTWSYVRSSSRRPSASPTPRSPTLASPFSATFWLRPRASLRFRFDALPPLTRSGILPTRWSSRPWPIGLASRRSRSIRASKRVPTRVSRRSPGKSRRSTIRLSRSSPPTRQAGR